MAASRHTIILMQPSPNRHSRMFMGYDSILLAVDEQFCLRGSNAKSFLFCRGVQCRINPSKHFLRRGPSALSDELTCGFEELNEEAVARFINVNRAGLSNAIPFKMLQDVAMAYAAILKCIVALLPFFKKAQECVPVLLVFNAERSFLCHKQDSKTFVQVGLMDLHTMTIVERQRKVANYKKIKVPSGNSRCLIMDMESVLGSLIFNLALVYNMKAQFSIFQTCDIVVPRRSVLVATDQGHNPQEIIPQDITSGFHFTETSKHVWFKRSGIIASEPGVPNRKQATKAISPRSNTCLTNSTMPQFRSLPKNKNAMFPISRMIPRLSKEELYTHRESMEMQSMAQDNREEEVHCQVGIISWRERHISASIRVNASEDHVWEVLTDYERLPEFIPHLVHSKIVPCPQSGHVWLLQRAARTTMYWHIEASAILELKELPHLVEGKELQFYMVEGDFKKYAGRWFLRPGPRHGTTTLHYEVNVIPKLIFPTPFVEKIIKADLPINLHAMAKRAEEVSSGLIRSVSASTYSASTYVVDKEAPMEASAKVINVWKGKKDVLSTIKDLDMCGWSINKKDWKRRGKAGSGKRQRSVDEVHLRRLSDSNGYGGHWHVLASITIQALIEEVWRTLTSYESLSKFLPNLAKSIILSREDNHLQILQEGYKRLMYMVLHARVVLELCERPLSEITFHQVEGDFESLQGKCSLDALGSQHTLLRYVVNVKMKSNCFLPDGMIEEIAYEDLPENLCAIRDELEIARKGLQHTVSDEKGMTSGRDSEISPQDVPDIAPHQVNSAKDELKPETVKKKRDPVKGLQKDFDVLENELQKFIKEHGESGYMPVRSNLRKKGRVDLEKAISRMGGFQAVADRLGIRLSYKQRKPKGYWNSLENIRKELHDFQISNGKDPSQMPTRRSLEKKGRYDLARAFEKWGGIYEVAVMLGMKPKHHKLLDTRSQSPTQDDRET